jgi:GntR family transcriptional regulator
MHRQWDDRRPIYLQLRERIVAMILDGTLKESNALPSARKLADEYRVNVLTVLKGYQQLADEGLVEAKRGRGTFIKSGARDRLLEDERHKFLIGEWPRVLAIINRLGLTIGELPHSATEAGTFQKAPRSNKTRGRAPENKDG